MDGGGFEPPKQFAADLQSVPFGHSGIHPLARRCLDNDYLYHILIKNATIFLESFTFFSNSHTHLFFYPSVKYVPTTNLAENQLIPLNIPVDYHPSNQDQSLPTSL